MKHHHTDIRVRYAETDAQGVVHHSNYPIWLEQARTELMRDAGLPYSELERRGLRIMLSKLELTFKRAARYDEVVRIETSVLEMKSRKALFGYRLTLPDGSLIALAQTDHFCADPDFRVIRFPDDVLERFG